MKLCTACDSIVPKRICPHCGASVGVGARSTPLIHILGLVVTSMAAPACATSLYGLIAVQDENFDGDEDGWGVGLDCNDSDPEINPGAAETPGDSVDSNCDGSDDPQA